MSQVAGDELLAAREALERFEWERAFELFSAADEREELGPEDVERLAFAATWARSIGGAAPYMERAYNAFLAAVRRDGRPATRSSWRTTTAASDCSARSAAAG